MNNRTEEKLKDVSGMEKAIKDLLQQAWGRGYKYGLQKGYESGLRDNVGGEFTVDELEKWLYEIADNNNNDFGKDCLEIVGRLDGFENFVADMRKEAENER